VHRAKFLKIAPDAENLFFAVYVHVNANYLSNIQRCSASIALASYGNQTVRLYCLSRDCPKTDMRSLKCCL